MKPITSLSFVFVTAVASTALALVSQAAPAVVAKLPAIAVVGASASHGFRLGEFLGADAKAARARIAQLLGRAPDDAEFAARTQSIGLAPLLRELHGGGESLPITDDSDQMLFLSPARAAKRQLDAVLAGDAELVLAVDLMFWFGYGSLSGNERADAPAARRARQQQAFALLDAVLADERWGARKLVLGDYPDCSDASDLMISASMRPDAATLARLNETLRAWAAKHSAVRVFPLARLLDDMKAGRVADAHGRPVAEGAALQFDRLHPTRAGMELLLRALAAFVGEQFTGLGPLVPAAAGGAEPARRG